MTGAGFEASGCGAMVAAGSAAVALVSGAPVLDAARVGTAAIAAELGGLSPGKLHAAELAADALHRALGLAARADAAVAADPGRVLVAMSGGVDSAVAGLLTRLRRGGRDARAVGRRGQRRRGLVLLRARGAGRARARARDGDAALHARPARRSSAPAWSSRGWPGTRRGRRRTRASAATATCGSTRCWSSPTRSAAPSLATGHYARVSEDGLLRCAADPAKDQAYMLCALSPATLARMRFPLGELTKPEVRALAAEAELPVASKADSQDLCFLAGTGPRRVPGAPRRRARAAGGDRRPRRARARPPPRPPRLHGRPAQGDRCRGAGAAVRARHRRAHEPRDGRRAGGAGHARGGGPRRDAAPAGRGGRLA